MAFRLPAMPLFANIFVGHVTPPLLPLVLRVNVACQLRYLKTAAIVATAFGPQASSILLLVPPGTDIRMTGPGTFGDIVEVPAGTGRYYRVFGVDDVAKGFANTYRAAVLVSMNGVPGTWPTPYP